MLKAEFKKLSKAEQETLLNWCRNIGKRKTINKGRTSYSLKHIFERSKSGFYITNDVFKEAMLKVGFNYEFVDNKGVNWCFNYSEKSLKEIIKNDENLKESYK
mgnify:CR=1 FL=1